MHIRPSIKLPRRSRRGNPGPEPSRTNGRVSFLVATGIAAIFISLAVLPAEGTKASIQIVRSHPMARRGSRSEVDGVYTINYFKADGRVVSERFMGKLAMAQERVDQAVANRSFERAQIQEGRSGKIIYRSGQPRVRQRR